MLLPSVKRALTRLLSVDFSTSQNRSHHSVAYIYFYLYLLSGNTQYCSHQHHIITKDSLKIKKKDFHERLLLLYLCFSVGSQILLPIVVKHAAIIVTDISSRSGDSSFMACVIAQRRVHPVAVHGNPLTEHKLLLVRARECVDQQVPSFAGWTWRSQPRRPEGIHLASRAHHLREALTCVPCWRRSPTTGKVGLLTWSLLCLRVSVCNVKGVVV